MKSIRRTSLVLLILFCGQGLFAEASEPLFEDDIQPVLMDKCGQCHDAKSKKGELDLSTMLGLKRGGESGESGLADTVEDS
ncbi:hypothetical protein OAK47_03575, partial [Planctomycetaceae bacterium]|nr:hypothetical protein [Planctomycetaceae bacterium]